MEKSVEFFVLGNKTCICRNGESRPLRPTDRDAVTFMLENISRTFPEALEALQQFASASQRNLHYYEFIMVDRFIRCNFGEADFLHPDIDDLGMFHFEEVRCPLRGYLTKKRRKWSASMPTDYCQERSLSRSARAKAPVRNTSIMWCTG